MTSRALLHKSKIPDFCRWLTSRGIAHRAAPPSAQWQIMQVRVGNGWQAIYSRAHMPEHVSVPNPLVKIVTEFVNEPKSESFKTNGPSSPGAAPEVPVYTPGLPE
jgi:hypothetical protein